MAIAVRAVERNGHRMCDVVLCCQPSAVDVGGLIEDLKREFAADPVAAIARAKAISEIWELAE